MTDTSLLLMKNPDPVPPANLMNFQPDNFPFDTGTFSYSSGAPGFGGTEFTAQVDRTILLASTAPEPGSLTLFLLGAIGLAARRLRRCFGE